jgi:AcrR family transcriptional regulator
MVDEQSARLTQAQRRDHTRQKLLAAATDLFSKSGYHRTQVMDIVTKAHVSAGTFYRYFDDKQGIFFAIAEELGGHEVEEAIKARAMILEAPCFADAVRNMVQFLERHFERVVQRAPLRKSGPADTEDLDSLARMIMGVLSELRYAMIQTGKPSPTQAARLVTRFLQGAMAAYRTRCPRFAGLHSDEWREALDAEART